MSWSVARAAIDQGLASRPEVLGVVLSGGEPLLVPDLVRRCIEHLSGLPHSPTRVELTLSTNGLLLTPDLVELLAGVGATVHLSLDGIAEAQRHRGAGVACSLDRLLDTLRRTQPAWLRERVVATMVMLPATLPALGRSVRHLIDRGVGTIRMGPRMTPDPDWGPDSPELLRTAVDDVLELSLDYWRETGETPVEFLRPGSGNRSRRRRGPLPCRAGSGTAFCVDPDGRAWPCIMFAGSIQRLTPRAEEVSGALSLGDVRDPQFRDRLAAVPDAASRLGPLADATPRLAQCASCEALEECQTCPYVLCVDAEDEHPQRTFEFSCAFTCAAHSARERFGAAVCGDTLAGAMTRVERTLCDLERALHDLASF